MEDIFDEIQDPKKAIEEYLRVKDRETQTVLAGKTMLALALPVVGFLNLNLDVINSGYNVTQLKDYVGGKISKFLDTPATKEVLNKMTTSVVDDMIKNNKLNHSDISDNSLQHWGILGMHWGVRRYQNPGGTLTEAGKKRYAKLRKKAERLEPKAPPIAVKSRNDIIDEEIRSMSPEDLRNATNRIQGEENYRRERLKTLKTKNVKDMTNDEIRYLNEKIKLEREYASLNSQQKKTVTEKLNKMGDFFGASFKIIDSASKTYNAIVRVFNAFGDKELPLIDTNANKSSDQKNKARSKRK